MATWSFRMAMSYNGPTASHAHPDHSTVHCGLVADMALQGDPQCMQS